MRFVGKKYLNVVLFYDRHKTGKTGRIPTCIAGHPEEECIATGDSTGRVVVWKSLFQTRPYTAVYHWHTLPVTEIAFSKSGNCLNFNVIMLTYIFKIL